MCLQLSAVGGDWYDYLRLGKRLWGIALGDVCGKGMAAALLMSATRSLFRTAAEGLRSPSEVLARLNKSLMKDLPTGRFVTLVYLVLDTERATASIASAGHPQPLYLSRQTGVTELRTEKGLPLGLMDSEYSEVELRLQSEDRVLMYTDGILEATNSKGEEFGNSRLEQALQKPGTSAVAADAAELDQGKDRLLFTIAERTCVFGGAEGLRQEESQVVAFNFWLCTTICKSVRSTRLSGNSDFGLAQHQMTTFASKWAELRVRCGNDAPWDPR